MYARTDICLYAFLSFPYNVDDTSFRLFDTLYETIHSSFHEHTIYISATVRAEVHDQKEHRL